MHHTDVSWELHVNRFISEDKAREEHVDEVWTHLSRLSADINYLRYEQSYQRARWTRTFEIQDDIHFQTTFFGYFRAVLLVLVGVGQVLFLRAMFNSPQGARNLGVGFRPSAFGRKNPLAFS